MIGAFWVMQKIFLVNYRLGIDSSTNYSFTWNTIGGNVSLIRLVFINLSDSKSQCNLILYNEYTRNFYSNQQKWRLLSITTQSIIYKSRKINDFCDKRYAIQISWLRSRCRLNSKCKFIYSLFYYKFLGQTHWVPIRIYILYSK